MGELSRLGHFLKGSSATLGVAQVRNACEQIQYLGRLVHPEDHSAAIAEPEALSRISKQLQVASGALAEAEQFFNQFYHQQT